MRHFVLISSLAAAGALAACGGSSPQRVSASPPMVSYQVSSAGLGDAGAKATMYCQQYNSGAQLVRYADGVALFECNGAIAASGTPTTPGLTAPAPVATAPLGAPGYAPPAVQCADAMHQSRPGGTDYNGPPIAGCPQQ